jgi:hypothetical protein
MARNCIHQRRAEVDMEGQAKRDRGHETYKAGGIEFQYMCDLCDKKTPLKYVYWTEKPVYLCPNCYEVISAMPGGKIKDSIMRFLMRNVI